MNDEIAKINFSQYYNVTTLHPLAGAALLITAVLVYVLPKRYVAPACLPLLCFVSGAQRIVIGGVDLGFLRLVGLVVLVRIISRGDFRGNKIQFADLLVFAFSFWPVIAAILRGHTDVIMMTLGLGFDIFSMYLLGRVYLSNFKEWGIQIRALAWVSVPIAILFAIEGATRHNLFAVFGGVSEVTRIRDGQLRAQGAFAHPILAGAWFVAVIPLFLSQLKADANRLRGQATAVCGTICALIVILAVSSATPMGGLFAIAAGYMFYPFRSNMRRIAIVAILFGILLHFIANDGLHGVLFTRFSLVVGSTGGHRFTLYQAAIDHMSEWFLVGVNSTAHWGYRLWDVTSEYINNLVKGGMLSLTMMIGLLYLGYRGIGRAMRGRGKREIALLYGLGVSLFVHIMMFSAVSYFGQITYLLYSLIGGMISLGMVKNTRPADARPLVRRPLRRSVGPSNKPLIES